MECPLLTQENAELLLAYCARKLDAETVRVLESHMEHCEACRRFGESQKLVWDALDTWEATPVSMDFDRRLYSKIDAEQQQSWMSRLFSPLMPHSLPLFLRPALPLAAACLMVLAVFLVQSPTQNELARQVRMERQVDVDKVESALEDLEMLQQFSVIASAEEDPVKSL